MICERVMAAMLPWDPEARWVAPARTAGAGVRRGVRSGREGVRVPRRSGGAQTTPWLHASAEEALESLVTSGILPWSWADPESCPLWAEGGRHGWSVCRSCDGSGTEPGHGARGRARRCADCEGHGTEADLCRRASSDPPGHHRLAAVASLGPDVVASVPELASVAFGTTVRVVWMAETERWIASKLYDNARWMSHGDDSPVSLYGFGVSGTRSRLSGDTSPGSPLTTDAAEASWPSLYRLWTHGAHMVGASGDRVAICVDVEPWRRRLAAREE